MGHYACGDSTKMICSSDEEEGYRGASRHPSRTTSAISRMNQCDKRNLILGTFGEAPPLPLPPVSDETDRQFWAEDELSSCESSQLVVRRKRRHSVAYRNRAAVHRSRSGLCDSSSSSTETACVNIPPSVIRRRFRNCPGTSKIQRTRVSSAGFQTNLNAKTVSPSVATASNLTSSCDIVQPVVHGRRFNISILSRRKKRRTGGTRIFENPTVPSRTPSKSEAGNGQKKAVSKLMPPTKSRRQ